MKKFMIVITLMITVSLAAMTQDKLALSYSFGKNVNVRAEPEINAKVVYQLSLGEAFYIVNKENRISAVNGYQDYWYRIKYGNEDGYYSSGYIWGGFIANQSFKIDYDDDGKEELFLIRNFTQGAYSELNDKNRNLNDSDNNLNLKIVSEGALKYEMNLPCPGEANMVTIKKIISNDFSPAVKFLSITYGCSGETFGSFENLYVIGEKPEKVFELYSNGEGGYTIDYTILFPKDARGKENTIVVKVTESEAGAGDKIRFEEYVWSKDKKTFVKK